MVIQLGLVDICVFYGEKTFKSTSCFQHRKPELLPGATEKIIDKVGLTVLAKNLHITWWEVLMLYMSYYGQIS